MPTRFFLKNPPIIVNWNRRIVRRQVRTRVGFENKPNNNRLYRNRIYPSLSPQCSWKERELKPCSTVREDTQTALRDRAGFLPWNLSWMKPLCLILSQTCPVLCKKFRQRPSWQSPRKEIPFHCIWDENQVLWVHTELSLYNGLNQNPSFKLLQSNGKFGCELCSLGISS